MGKQYILTFSPIFSKNDTIQIFLFCKELVAPARQHQNLLHDDIVWKSLLKLTHSVSRHSDWQHSINNVFPDMCTALDANDLFYLNTRAHNGASPGHYKQHSLPHQYDWIFSIPRWMKFLETGETIHNITPKFNIEEQSILHRKNILTILLIPIIVNKELRGLLGIQRKEKAVLFTQQQINSLLVASSIFSMAIENQDDRSERDRLTTVIEQSSDCIIILNPKGIIHYANPACTNITGFSPKEIIGKSIQLLHAPPTREENWLEIKKALITGKPWNGQFSNFRKDNTAYEEEILISPVYDKEGEILNQVITKRDITEDKRLESIVEAANLMENIGFIFSSIRHELGNPINSIKVSLSILKANLEGYNTETITSFIHRSLSDVGRVEYLLKTLRNFSMFERPDIQNINMLSLVDEIIQLSGKELEKNNIMLVIQHPKEILIAKIDPRAFLQVLLNLITNAVAALSEEDEKTITISLVQEKNNQISFIFEDNGCGMKEETVQNLFRPFFTTKEEGTGLGLVIAKKMLAKMHCSIAASSKKGTGTRIEIIIPAA